MLNADGQRINEYSNSLFRYEHLPARWIRACARYLRALFGDSLRGKTVIDYAFGRGNWSLAFLLAGARKVVAIDASYDTVARFRRHCELANVTGVQIIAGNILEQDFAIAADLIWVYGILPAINDPSTFLNRIRTLASGPDAKLYVYQYNAHSLREFTVQTCRRVLLYQTENEFRTDSPLFVRPARMRARDDLTAPCVTFSTASQLRDLLRRSGLYVTRQDPDFQQFLTGRVTEDFYPHQFLCSLRPQDERAISEPPVPYADEVNVLWDAARTVFSLPLSPVEKRHTAIGLYNTHFAFLRQGSYARDSLIEILLFLFYSILQRNVDIREVPASVAPYYALFCSALDGRDRSGRRRLVPNELHDDTLVQYLVNHHIRA